MPNCVCYDARGNGDGAKCPTLTGDHENRVTDYTAISVFRKLQFGAYVQDTTFSTLNARDYKDAADLCVEVEREKPRRYIVRRLTPLEYNRLQGFPDGWGAPDRKDELTDAETDFWEGVRKTHAEVNGKRYKLCASRTALVRWYNGLHTDSAEYKMWGNGIAPPNAAFVLRGVSEVLGMQRHEVVEQDTYEQLCQLCNLEDGSLKE